MLMHASITASLLMLDPLEMAGAQLRLLVRACRCRVGDRGDDDLRESRTVSKPYLHPWRELGEIVDPECLFD